MIVLKKDNKGPSELLYVLRRAPKSNCIFLTELQLGRKLITIKDIITTKATPNNHTVSENDSNFELELSNFPSDQVSETLVRERARCSKLENDFKRKKGSHRCNTVTLKERSKSQPKLYSKRDVAHSPKKITQPTDQSIRHKIEQAMRAIQPKEATTPKQPNTPPRKKRKSERIQKTTKLARTTGKRHTRGVLDCKQLHGVNFGLIWCLNRTENASFFFVIVAIGHFKTCTFIRKLFLLKFAVVHSLV